MKHDRELERFLRDEVDLHPSQLDEAKSVYGRVRKELESGYGDRLLDVRLRGSYFTDTIIRPNPNGDSRHDIDVFFTLRDDESTSDPIDVLQELERFISNRVGGVYRRKNVCVCIEHTGDLCADIIPYIKRNDAYYICNREEKEFKISDRDGQNNWFNAIDRKHDKKVSACVRLFKYIRSRKKDGIPAVFRSFVFATLFGLAAEGMHSEKRGVTETLVLLMEHIHRTSGDLNYRLPKPTLPSEDLFWWYHPGIIEELWKGLGDLAGKMREALDETDEGESLKKWRELFGDTFGKR